jgi:hypothetical protein
MASVVAARPKRETAKTVGSASSTAVTDGRSRNPNRFASCSFIFDDTVDPDRRYFLHLDVETHTSGQVVAVRHPAYVRAARFRDRSEGSGRVGIGEILLLQNEPQKERNPARCNAVQAGAQAAE